MAKRFKLKLSLPSFQFCRSKKTTTLPQTLSPVASYLFSPVNPKSFEIAYPNFPNPPPSTPNHPQSQIASVNFGCRSRSQINVKSRQNTKNPVISDDSDGDRFQTGPSKPESGWFSSEGEESESLLSSSRSFDSSNFEFGYPMETIDERPRRKKKKNMRVRRLNRINVSKINNGKESDEKVLVTTPESESPVRKSVFRRMMPCTVDGKVKDSFAVVKRSEDPYEDFKRSMMEMILEKQIFEANDLEQLLRCFLSLNSQHHHKAIVGAFTEIWELLFCESS